MKYALIFSIAGVALIIFSFNRTIFSWLFLWLGVNFIAVGTAYAGIGPQIFAKKLKGSMSKKSLCLLPYLALTWVVWYIQIVTSKEDCCNEIAPGIWIGRRLYANELPSNISLIIDLTAEFPEPPSVLSGKTYICIPTLDISVPPESVFYELIQKITNWEGNVYIHCALGHGRSATVAAGVLIAKGFVHNIQEAEEVLKTARPGIKFSPAQKNLLKKYQFHTRGF